MLSDDFPALNKDVKVEVVEDEDLDALDLGLDEDSSQSWATRQTIWDRKQEVEQKSSLFRYLSYPNICF